MQDNPQYDEYKERLTNFSHEFDLGLFIHIVKRSAFWVVLLVVLSVLLSFLYLRYTPEVYEARTVIQLGEDDSGGRILNVNRVTPEGTLDAKVELLRSKLLVQRTLERMNLDVSYFAKGRILTNEHYIISPYRVDVIEVFNEGIRNKPIFIDFNDDLTYNLRLPGRTYTDLDTGKLNRLDEFVFKLKVHNPDGLLPLKKDNELFFRLNTVNALTRKFVRGIDIRVLNSTAKTIEVNFKDNNPFLVRDFVAMHSDEFIRFDLEKRQRSDDNIIAFIDAQIDSVYQKLRGSESLLNEYKQANKITSLSNLSSVYLDRLTDLEDRIVDLEVEERVLVDVEKLSQIESGDIEINNLIPLIAGSSYETSLTSQLERLEDLLVEREEVYFRFTDDNIAVRSIEYQIDIHKKLIVETIRALRVKVGQRKEELYDKLRLIESVYYGLPVKELEYARLERIFSINEKYYTRLLEKRIEYRISKEGFVSQNQILEDAFLPNTPISPKGKVIFLSFVLAGVLFGFILISVRYLVHNNITTLNEIVRLSNASIATLGVVPQYKENIPLSMLLVDRSPKSIIAESFRTIRTNMQFIDNTEGSKMMAITSTISGEGKTFIALNLAGIIAFSGKKVIVLDLDMRRPRIHKGMDVDNDNGMSTLLIGRTQLDDCIRPTNIESLQFITAGPIPPNPSELILSERMNEIITELKKRYDMIIIDTPPVGLVTDGVSIISRADYPIYVFRADYSKKRFVQNVDRLINESRITRLSVVLNGVDLDRNKYSYSYGYGYGYGYEYSTGGYYDETPRKKGFLKRLFRR